MRIEEKRPNIDIGGTPILKAIAYGITAPNPHNTEAWKIKVISDEEMLLYIDEKRLLPSTDPPARQIHIGSGCFIEVLSIGAKEMGYKTKVDYYPEGVYGFEEIGKKPVAKIVLSKDPTLRKDPLFEYIYTRQTNRKAYSGPMVTNLEFEKIRELVGEAYPNIIAMNEKKVMQPFLDIFSKAIRIEATTSHHLWEETRIWMRWNERDRAEKRDGLSVPQSGADGLKRILMEWYLQKGNVKRWFSKMTINSSLADYDKGIMSSKGIVFFQTDTNTPLDWVETGRGYARFHLAITKYGMYLHPYSQVLQEYPEMNDLREEFNNLFDMPETGKVQMTVRIGRGKKPYFTYRRNLNDFLME